MKVDMEEFRAACRRAAAGEPFKMGRKKSLSPGARVTLHVLIHGGDSLPEHLLAGFYRELLEQGLVELDEQLDWRPTKRGRRSNELLLATGWQR